ncbi:NAD(P)/FAD-dependent oxidoreductase [Anaerosalibacter sp. Marseille-P3206]|uniref:NAD(P)/FAD-dependent oxidoreductase n=1 Tax=Anaerosalibacter sp. Marseille-P3206 TaxID=1871005 RepID=UPI0009846770|nr:NAD(P)/FAD-dependent oxidoreductase [Anaerosalibacter sp. Marseille-P3206]
MYDVAIIGAGIIGTFIARELSRYKLSIVLIEKENDISNGCTKANTGIVHAGYDAKPGTKMATFNVKGNPMFDKVCEELDVPFKRIGSLVVGFDEEDENTIRELYERGKINGVPNLQILDRKRVLEMEPNIGDEVIVALYAPTAGIVGPWELAIALAENAIDNGVELFLNNEVKNITKIEEGFIIETVERIVEAECVINCGGIYSDKINNMVSEEKYVVTPRAGQYYVLDKSVGKLTNTTIFECPKPYGKGVVVTPTVHGNMMIGPDNKIVSTKESKETTMEGLRDVKDTAGRSVKGIPFNKTITNFTGLRNDPSTGDFIIGEASDVKGFINVGGIKSPGLTSSPAIAEYVVELVDNVFDGLIKKDDFNPRRRKMTRFEELSEEEKNEIIKENPSYGRIICRCETITEGEIVDSIHRNAGARTVDGVKRRVRPGSGRCQGGFCSPRVMEILARELKVDVVEIVKDSKDSYILTGPTKEVDEVEGGIENVRI